MMEYKVGDKFEIEIAEVYESGNPFGNGIDLYRIKGFNSLIFGKNGLDKLKKIKEEPPKPKTVKASELVADTLVICHDEGDACEKERRFAGMLNGKLYACEVGVTSKGEGVLIPWDYMTLKDGTEVLAE